MSEAKDSNGNVSPQSIKEFLDPTADRHSCTADDVEIRFDNVLTSSQVCTVQMQYQTYVLRINSKYLICTYEFTYFGAYFLQFLGR